MAGLCRDDRCWCRPVRHPVRERLSPVSRANVPDEAFLLSFAIRGTIVGFALVLAYRFVRSMIDEINYERGGLQAFQGR
jgi:hypothetical protein